jgi:hypothetical protein
MHAVPHRESLAAARRPRARFAVALIAALPAMPLATAGASAVGPSPHLDRHGSVPAAHRAGAGGGGARLRVRARASVIGGHPAAEGVYPWLAFIEDRFGSSIDQCTGTVVAPNLVLTAGHCAEETTNGVEYDAADYFVTIGTADRTSPAAQHFRVSELIVLPGYNPASNERDASLLVLSTPTTAPVISLAAPPAQPTHAWIVGWGETFYGQEELPNVLQWAETTAQSPQECFDEGVNSKVLVCAIDKAHHANTTCEGDSGGPLLVSGAAGMVEVGVVSFGVNNCSTSYSTAFTSAAVLAGWLREATAALAPLLQQPLTTAAVPVPGVYTTVRSQTHRVSARVSSDGLHLVHLSAKATLGCQHGRSAAYGVAGFPTSEPAAISAQVLRASGSTAAGRSWYAGRFGIYMHFDATGIVEGRLQLRVRSRNPRLGLCYAPTVRFLAYRASA